MVTLAFFHGTICLEFFLAFYLEVVSVFCQCGVFLVFNKNDGSCLHIQSASLYLFIVELKLLMLRHINNQ